jgi:Na+(H+)/acetate symporter ActP
MRSYLVAALLLAAPLAVVCGWPIRITGRISHR